MLSLGATRVEIGIQTIYPEILEKIQRGHTIQDTIDAIRIARDAGYKIVLHVMPGLPGSDFEKDLEMFYSNLISKLGNVATLFKMRRELRPF